MRELEKLKWSIFAIGAFSICLSRVTLAAKPTPEEALAAEPEMARIYEIEKTMTGYNSTGHAPAKSLFNNYAALTTVSDLYDQLDERLQNELIACEGKCASKEQEWFIMMKRKAMETTILGQHNDSAPIAYYYALPEQQWQPMIPIGDYCSKTAGLPTHEEAKKLPVVGRYPPDKLAVYSACRKPYSNIEDVNENHDDASGKCKPFYNRAKNVFEQQPYDNCMNEADWGVAACTKLRRYENKPGKCPGPLPPG